MGRCCRRNDSEVRAAGAVVDGRGEAADVNAVGMEPEMGSDVYEECWQRTWMRRSLVFRCRCQELGAALASFSRPTMAG